MHLLSSRAGGDSLSIGRIAGGAAVLIMIALCAQGAVPVKKSTQMVPMRDGVRLATDVYLPQKAQEPLPAILVRTPYSKENNGRAMGQMACDRGYALVVQDLRGRFESEGEATLVFHTDGWGDRRDGHDTIEWIAQERWSSGKVATWGASALGITQNMLAPGAPAALKAQYVMVAFSNAYMQAAFQGGAFRKELAEKWLKGNRFSEKNLQMIFAHPRYDGLWAELNPEAQAAHINAPAVYYGGWYDVFLQGTINQFLAVHNQGGPGARGKCRLVIGPWAHQAEGLEGSFRFFDHWLKGARNGLADEQPVRYFVMADPSDPKAPGNYWRSADHWPPPAVPTKFYFHPDGTLRRTPPAGDDKRTYRYDPKNPVPTLGGQNLHIDSGPRDQRQLEGRGDVLVYTTETLTEPVEITGRIEARLYVSSDCPDTDFTVKLTDVFPSGPSMLVTDGITRARYRESFERESFLEPGKVYEVPVDLWSASVIVNKGYKIRVAVSSSNAPRFDPNPNTGRPLRADQETRVATNTLHLSRRYPSHIVLPVYGGPPGGEK